MCGEESASFETTFRHLRVANGGGSLDKEISGTKLPSDCVSFALPRVGVREARDR